MSRLFSYLTNRLSVANQSGAMRVYTILKMGRSSKSHTSRSNIVCFILLAAGMFFSTSVFAQNESEQPQNKKINLYFEGGFGFGVINNTSKIDNYLKNNGYPDYNTSSFMTMPFNCGCGFYYKRFAFGINANIYFGGNDNFKNEIQNRRLYGGGGSFLVEYFIWKSDSRRCYLSANTGFGMDGTSFSYSRNDGRSETYSWDNNGFIPIGLYFCANGLGFFLQYNIPVYKDDARFTGTDKTVKGIGNVSQNSLMFGVKLRLFYR